LLHLGVLARGFLFGCGKLVVVTDAEIFGRYKIQRPRRLKSPHAQTSRSLLDIDFTDLEEGDYVVHLQHGIGRYLGVKFVPTVVTRRNPDRSTPEPEGGEECLVIEYAPGDADQTPPKLYVPVTERKFEAFGGTWVHTGQRGDPEAADRIDLAFIVLADDVAVHVPRDHYFTSAEWDSDDRYQETSVPSRRPALSPEAGRAFAG